MAEVTIRTIAKESGVSPSMVSQVLNNRPVRVSEETRKRILSVAGKYRYVPNKIAASLKLKSTKTIGLLAPFTPYGFFSNLIYNVQKYATDAGYLTMVVNTFEDPVHEVKEMELFRSGLFDGMLVAPLSNGLSGPLFQEMAGQRFPFVCVDRSIGNDLPSVSSDHEKVGYDLTRRAIVEGKRDILFIGRCNATNSAGLQRKEGYLRAMADSALAPRTVGFSYVGDHDLDLRSMCSALRDMDQPPEAFFIHSGYYLPLLVQALKSMDMDVSRFSYLMVDGFSFSPDYAGSSEPWFAGVVGHCSMAIQDIDSIARRAVGLLVSSIQNGGVVTPGGVVVEPRYQQF
ncbi:MAG: LacI family DNA-binding transcriptional regulator [Sphaerochaetaceae bacterium]|nr:LacI family DNA-binding transcriptional regulator [Spirochaetales bacterium]MDY5499260.1 LacI family DNA-binding transcriptional regulator [Sphaerochaetaceae bacterium]